MIKRFDQFNFNEANEPQTKKSMVDAGEFRMYVGKTQDVTALMTALEDKPELSEWVDQVSPTQVRVTLAKDPDVAHALRALVDGKGLIKMDYNSLEEALKPGYSKDALLAILKPVLNEVYEATFTEEAKRDGVEDKDHQVLAHILTHFFEWDYEDLTKVYAYALEDANFHDEAKKVGAKIGLEL